MLSAIGGMLEGANTPLKWQAVVLVSRCMHSMQTLIKSIGRNMAEDLRHHNEEHKRLRKQRVYRTHMYQAQQRIASLNLALQSDRRL